jgi:hypothetical protein
MINKPGEVPGLKHHIERVKREVPAILIAVSFWLTFILCVWGLHFIRVREDSQEARKVSIEHRLDALEDRRENQTY